MNYFMNDMTIELFVTMGFGFATLAGGVIATYVALVVKITKVATKLDHVEKELIEEKQSNEQYKNETSIKLSGIYKALTEIKILIATKGK